MLPQTVWKYSVPKITVFTKCVKRSGTKSLKPSCNIQPFKNSRWKSTVWRCEHYLINWQNIFTVSIQHNPHDDRLYASASSTSQETAFAHDVNVQSTFFPAALPNVNRFKKCFSPVDSAISLKNTAIENFIAPQCVATLPLWFFVNCDIRLRMSLVFRHYVLQGSAGA